MDSSVWPLAALRIVTPRVVLRYPDDDDVFALAALAARGVHDPATMPFTFPWTDAEPLALQRSSAQWYWRQRAEWSVEHWNLTFAVVVDGEVVGTQGVMADSFPVLREVSTGSWLGRSYQGKGIGKEMRAAVVQLAFDGLGAAYALTGAFHDNEASLAVTRSLGYAEEGRRRVLRRDQPDWLVGYRLSREQWEPRRRGDIVIEGLDPCLDMFGVTSG
jgi:RimJ/RimL family protein N-acetyltransferase